MEQCLSAALRRTLPTLKLNGQGRHAHRLVRIHTRTVSDHFPTTAYRCAAPHLSPPAPLTPLAPLAPLDADNQRHSPLANTDFLMIHLGPLDQ
jgi:hypothetical protein